MSRSDQLLAFTVFVVLLFVARWLYGPGPGVIEDQAKLARLRADWKGTNGPDRRLATVYDRKMNWYLKVALASVLAALAFGAVAYRVLLKS